MSDINSADAAPPNAATKKRRYLRWLAAAAFLFMAWFCWQLFGPNPPIVVSKETTYITEPLRPDGLPDYERWMLEKYRAGVTPENNAGALLYQSIWPGGLDPQDYRPVCDELGLAKIPDKGALQNFPDDQLVSAIREWLRPRGPDFDDADYASELPSAATGVPWKASDCPPLAAWITSHEESLGQVVEATKRPRLYLPSPSLTDNKHITLVAMLLPGVQGEREAARALTARAMLNLGEGRLAEAWSDALAVHRLGCLATQGQTVVEKLVAIAIQGIARDAMLAILSDQKFSPEMARQFQVDLAGLNCEVGMADALAVNERMTALSAVVDMKLYGPEVLSEDFERNPRSYKPTSVDWNIVLRHVNRWYDKLAEAVAPLTFPARQEASRKFDAELRSNLKAESLLTIRVSRKARSESIGKVVIGVFIPALDAAMSAEDRNTAMSQLLNVAAAFAVYRAEHGEYPENLEQLVPEVIAKLPVDLFHDKPYIYKRDADGYLLYSCGPNGIDDGGSHEQLEIADGRGLDEISEQEAEAARQQIPTGADDIAIRVPRPPFKLPAIRPGRDASAK